jgi:hypothetical protein
VLEKNRA